ncbi:MAG TPA: hypothetical protein VEK39_11695 [Solirubrobacterales bacterium]|nr:hypothetical protein [Solirubrobacterales bacterium]
MKRAFISVVAALGVAGLVAGGALAAKTYTTTVPVPQYSNTLFTGKIAAKGGCQKGRDVEVFDTSVPPGPTPEGTAGGSGTTNKKGKYTVDSPFEAQSGHSYVASVGKKTIKVNGEKHKCLAGASDPLAIP